MQGKPKNGLISHLMEQNPVWRHIYCTVVLRVSETHTANSHFRVIISLSHVVKEASAEQVSDKESPQGLNEAS